MNKFNLSLICITIICFCTQCKQPEFDYYAPDCTWQGKNLITFKSNLRLGHPKALVNTSPYKYIYSDDAIYYLDEIFGYHLDQKESAIYVTTKANGCKGTQSKYKDYYNANEVGARTLENLFEPTRADGTEVIVEIFSGPHYDSKGKKGYAFWTKTMTYDPFHTLQDGKIPGGFESKTGSKVRKSSTLRRIYVGNEFKYF